MKKLMLFFIFFFTQSAFADQQTDIMADLLKASLQTYVDHWRNTNHVPGVALTIYQPNKQTLITITSGKRRLNPAAPVTENTFFQIGSITKTFTSAAILKLEAEGKLSINNKIGPWFPQYPRWKNVTIQQLLNMTSGISGYETNSQFAKNELRKQWTTHDLINLAYNQRESSPPGFKWHYSNTNYLLLGEIIEKVTHESLDAIFNRYFYSKYHLNHTVVMSDTYGPAQLTHMAHGYKDNTDITAYNLSSFGGAGGMISTSQDIVTWINALFSGATLPDRQFHELLKTVPFSAASKPQNSRYGLGVYYTHSKKYGDIWWYSGVTYGYISLFMYLPKEKIIVAGNINRIKSGDFTAMMPNQKFVNGLLPIVTGTRVA